MSIVSVETRIVPLGLARPYTIATRVVTDVQVGLVILRDDAGRIGLGTATPAPHVTGETPERCWAALTPDNLGPLVGADMRSWTVIAEGIIKALSDAPAARAAIDMALADLHARTLGVPLCDVLGRCHGPLPTSITIGIKPTAEALAEADEYLARGFRILKVKIGRNLDEDLERLTKLRERVGRGVLIRADANQGYTLNQTRQFFASAAALAIDVEFLEQPVKADAIDGLRALAPSTRARIAADESLHSAADALRLATPPSPTGIFNIKLMKCGGVRPALAIAAIAEAAGRMLMWGCMDESCVGIAAALHAALACPATRYLDLDGSFDLARDVADGGFLVEDGHLRPVDACGLGVTLRA